MNTTASNQIKPRVASRTGFTIPEVIVAFGVLVTVIMASTSVVVSAVRNNQENENTLIAYFLAQEALEGIRNVRDSNWLLGADFQGKIGSSCVWGTDCLPLAVGKKHYFIIDRRTNANVFENRFGNPVGIEEISRYAPWKLKNITVKDVPPWRDGSVLAKLSLGLNEQTNESPLIQGKFHRYLEIVPKAYGDDSLTAAKYQVFAVITWRENLRDKEIRLGTELTNWKGGK